MQPNGWFWLEHLGIVSGAGYPREPQHQRVMQTEWGTGDLERSSKWCPNIVSSWCDPQVYILLRGPLEPRWKNKENFRYGKPIHVSCYFFLQEICDQVVGKLSKKKFDCCLVLICFSTYQAPGYLAWSTVEAPIKGSSDHYCWYLGYVCGTSRDATSLAYPSLPPI